MSTIEITVTREHSTDSPCLLGTGFSFTLLFSTRYTWASFRRQNSAFHRLPSRCWADLTWRCLPNQSSSWPTQTHCLARNCCLCRAGPLYLRGFSGFYGCIYWPNFPLPFLLIFTLFFLTPLVGRESDGLAVVDYIVQKQPQRSISPPLESGGTLWHQPTGHMNMTC